MSFASQPIAPGPLALDDLEHALGRLSAEERAALSWAPQRIRQALAYLQSVELTDDAVKHAAGEVAKAITDCWAAFFGGLGPPSVLRAEMSRLWLDHLQLLRSFLEDPAAADEAEWALRAVASVADVAPTGAFVTQERETPVSMHESARRGAVVGMLRAQVLLMALIDLANRSGAQERAGELADWAVVEAQRALGALAALGIRINVFASETRVDRSGRLDRYADAVRSALVPDDIEVLAAARLKSLR